MIISKTRIRTRYAESDQMGFIHHSSYVPYFEQARVELMRDMGCPYKEMEEKKFFLPLIDIYVKYLQPNKFDDELTVCAILDDMPGAKLTVRYEIYREEVLTTTGYTTHGFINAEGRPCRPPKDFVQICKDAFRETETK